MVSTSEDEVSELGSYDSNEYEMESEGVEEEEVEEYEEYEEEVEDRSDNDLEVMEILGHTETQKTIQKITQPEVVEKADSNAVSNGLNEKVSVGKKSCH